MQIQHHAAGLKRLWGEKRPLVVAVVALLFLLPVALSYMWAKDVHAPEMDTARIQAQQDTKKGEYSAAYSKLKASKPFAKTTADQVALYNDLAAAAANIGNPVEAIEYLLQKHRLDPKTAGADAYMLATLYETTNDSAKALQQYEAALTYYKSQPASPERDARVQSTEALLSQLRSSN